MAKRWPDKDPDEVLDYQLDWSARLGDDTISASLWIVPDGITKDSDSNTTTTTTVWLSGGSVSTRPYSVVNRVTTAAGRVMEESVSINITSTA